jgi:hypothetical protein
LALGLPKEDYAGNFRGRMDSLQTGLLFIGDKYLEKRRFRLKNVQPFALVSHVLNPDRGPVDASDVISSVMHDGRSHLEVLVASGFDVLTCWKISDKYGTTRVGK